MSTKNVYKATLSRIVENPKDNSDKPLQASVRVNPKYYPEYKDVKKDLNKLDLSIVPDLESLALIQTQSRTEASTNTLIVLGRDFRSHKSLSLGFKFAGNAIFLIFGVVTLIWIAMGIFGLGFNAVLFQSIVGGCSIGAFLKIIEGIFTKMAINEYDTLYTKTFDHLNHERFENYVDKLLTINENTEITSNQRESLTLINEFKEKGFLIQNGHELKRYYQYFSLNPVLHQANENIFYYSSILIAAFYIFISAMFVTDAEYLAFDYLSNNPISMIIILLGLIAATAYRVFFIIPKNKENMLLTNEEFISKRISVKPNKDTNTMNNMK
jgi:hypothetical protein